MGTMSRGPSVRRVAPSPSTRTDPGADFELRVVNACTQNDDLVLPRHPQPAVLAAFYEHGWRPELDAVADGLTCAVQTKADGAARLRSRRRGGDGRIGPKRRPRWRAGVPLTATQWLEQVPHVVLGRHSRLPPHCQLRHRCASRLHARVVYVANDAAHHYFTHTYPPYPCDRDDEPDPTQWTTPYYMLINHSDNLLYVNTTSLPRGASAVLREGDVIAALECAYDAEGGVLLRPTAADDDNDDNSSATGATTVQATPLQTQIRDTLAALAATRCGTSTPGITAADHGCGGVVTLHGRTLARRRGLEVHSSVRHYFNLDKDKDSVDEVNALKHTPSDVTRARLGRALRQLRVEAADGLAEPVSPLNGLVYLDVAALYASLVRRVRPPTTVTVIDVDACESGRESESRDVNDNTPLRRLIAELTLDARVCPSTPTATDQSQSRCVSTSHDELAASTTKADLVASAAPFLRLRPAALPVYVFARRHGDSPTAYTCERRTMSVAIDQTEADGQPLYVYYYDEATVEETQAQTGHDAHAAAHTTPAQRGVVAETAGYKRPRGTNAVVTAAETRRQTGHDEEGDAVGWIDQTGKGSGRGGGAKVRRRRRRRYD